MMEFMSPVYIIRVYLEACGYMTTGIRLESGNCPAVWHFAHVAHQFLISPMSNALCEFSATTITSTPGPPRRMGKTWVRDREGSGSMPEPSRYMDFFVFTDSHYGTLTQAWQTRLQRRLVTARGISPTCIYGAARCRIVLRLLARSRRAD